MQHPDSASPWWATLQRIVGRIGFGAKGVIYGLVGGMTVASGAKLDDKEYEESPKGAFVMIGDVKSGSGALFVLLIALWCYSIWRFWECLTYQGRDAKLSNLGNFFRFRLSPAVSGGVYIAYSYYIVIMLLNNYKNKPPSCYPNCWRETILGRTMLVLMGVAFLIACLTQLQNALTKRWHSEINWRRANQKWERWMLLTLGHIGYLGRAGIFVFVGILEFKALKHPVSQSGDQIADGLSQLLTSTQGRVAMIATGLCTLIFGLFCELCVIYRQFPTPPPSGIPWVHKNKHPVLNARH
ncbi:uncharacterized protein EV422DRAFT_493954 [Fimicolochytrium jonesii]|uniref:uncharacterized protein n=1 Tax=Fimicolochytrium jonesii TaxID=1396493 RepID=UPI0022FEB4CF|nr:uncharacterized protein EV422DRAFT_493954 [Fimicolochytrium jonesii]KAI8823660.1 hypothetical protein EV422DRAFT_493954 [Fimicolochytrium jonesii]